MSRRLLPVLLLGLALAGAAQPAGAQRLDTFERARLLRVLGLLGRGGQTPAPAAKAAGLAGDTGSISGTLRGLEPEACASAWVMAWSADPPTAGGGETGDRTHTAAQAAVEPDGSYRLGGLAPGSYYVSAAAKGYETQYYPGAADPAGAKPVEVPEDGAVEGIDFALVGFNAGEGSIAGAVTVAADGHPIAGAVVHAFSPDNPYRYGTAKTGADGTYEIRGLRSGRYVVEVWHPDYLPEFYADATVYEEAAWVEVAEPGQTAGVDFGLAAGGSITGVVRDGAGNPVAGAYVNADRSPGAEGRGWVGGGPAEGLMPEVRGGWAVTDESGAYRMGGLPSGAYRVQAQFSARWVYVWAWYGGGPYYEQAAPVAVAVGEETAGIDLVLNLRVANSAIAGRITDRAGNPVAKAFVTAHEAVDLLRPDSLWSDDPETPDGAGRAPIEAEVPAARVWAYGVTDEEGQYLIEELPAGTYVVGAGSENGWQYVQRWYEDATSPDQATAVPLGEGEQRRGIDIALPLSSATASISGTVRDQEGQPLAWAFVQIGPAEGRDAAAGADPSPVWAYGQTDSAGAYRVDRLPGGTYAVQASYSSGDRFGQSWFDGADGPQTATPLGLAEGESRAGVDLRLVVRPVYGVVAGTVTDAASGTPMSRAYVVLSPVERDVVRSAPLGYGAPWALTDDAGSFRLEWVPEGVYSLTVYANGASADRVQADGDPEAATFAVRGGETVRCAVPLSRRQDGEGTIAGSVTASLWFPGPLLRGEEPAGLDAFARPDSAAVPPEVAVVVALPASPADGGTTYTAVTEPDGAYALRGLPTGDYVVMCFAPGHVGIYYDGAYAPDRARKVRVEGAQQVGGIDFRLSGGYWQFMAAGAERDGATDMAPSTGTGGGATVYGNVADDAGRPVENATVYLLDAREQPVAFAQTSRDGSFELAGVAPGEYRVYASKLGYEGQYNGSETDFAAAPSLPLGGGQTEVNLVLAAGAVTAVEEEGGAALPRVLSLDPNCPNPFNPETRIAFAVPSAGRAVLRIYNALGQEVAVLYDGLAEAGRGYEAVFRAHGLGAGAYFCALEFQGQLRTRPMMLAK